VEDGIRFLSRKLSHWGINSQLVEDLILDMFDDKASLGNLLAPSWLGYLLQFLTRDLDLFPLPTSFSELRTSLLALDSPSLHSAITKRCHRICYPSLPPGSPFIAYSISPHLVPGPVLAHPPPTIVFAASSYPTVSVTVANFSKMVSRNFVPHVMKPYLFNIGLCVPTVWQIASCCQPKRDLLWIHLRS
jgi:hypothetical protein